MRIVKITFITVFIMILSFPYLNMELGFVEDLHIEEKREMAIKPQFEISEFYNYLDKYKAYFNDNYGLRNFLVNANLYIKYFFLNKTPFPDRVIIGKDGWLFLSPSLDLIISDKIDYLEPSIFKILEDSLISKTRQFKKMGIKYYIILVPEKSYTYSEWLPPGYDSERIKHRFDELVFRLDSNKELNIININKAVTDTKNKTKDTLYMKFDSHWNALGAYSAYKCIIQKMQTEYPSLTVRDEHNFAKSTSISYKGDLAQLINISKYVGNKEYKFEYNGPDAVNDSSVYLAKSAHSYAFKHPENKDKPDIIFLHDSFGVPFMPWLINDFHITHSLWIKDFSYDVNILSKVGPKIVIHEMVPRNTPLFKILVE